MHALRIPPRRRPVPPAPPRNDVAGGATSRPLEACDGLAGLVGEAAALDLDDPVAVARLRGAAHRVTAHHAARGWLPGHFVVSPGDAGVVVVKTLAAAASAVAAAQAGDGGRVPGVQPAGRVAG